MDSYKISDSGRLNIDINFTNFTISQTPPM